MRTEGERLRLFLAAAELLNFRAAAARCRVSPQVVTRVVQELEAQLGEVLFHRSTRGMRLSEFGLAFRARAQQVLAGLEGLFAPAPRAARAQAIDGLVRIAAPTMHGRRIVVPLLARLGEQHPGLVFELRLSDAVVDVVEEGIDIGLRGGRVRASRLVARAVAPVPDLMCAAPRLLARLGGVSTLEELDRAPVTQLIDRQTGRPWPWTLAGSGDYIPARTVFSTDDPLAECQAVVAGLGIGQLSFAVAQPHLQAGELVEVLPALRPRPWPLTVYRVRRDPVPARVRLVFNALVSALAAPPAH